MATLFGRPVAVGDGDTFAPGRRVKLRAPQGDVNGVVVPAGQLVDVTAYHADVDCYDLAWCPPGTEYRADGSQRVTVMFVPASDLESAGRGKPYAAGLDPKREGFGGAAAAAARGDVRPVPGASGDVASDAATLLDIIRRLSSGAASVDPAEVERIAEEVARRVVDESSAVARPVQLHVNGVPLVQLEGLAHAVLPDLVKRVHVGFTNLRLVGPAGSGKTTVCAQLATVLGREFATLSVGPGTTEAAFMGRSLPNLTTGENVYTPAPFVQLYQTGGVFLADEMDVADPSILTVLNAALANGHVTLPNGERVKRHADFVFVAAMNTFGNGADRMYVGRQQLDAATLDRFVGASFFMDYDAALESQLCPEAPILSAVHGVRRMARDRQLRRIVGTRAVVAARKLVVGLGMDVTAALRVLFLDWSADDLRAVGL